MTGYSLQDRPRVSEFWRLRNDGKYLLAYKPDAERKTYKALSGAEASIVLLMDGRSTIADIRDAFRRICGFPPQNADDPPPYFKEIMDSLLSVDGFISLNGKVSPSLPGAKVDLIPSLRDWHLPLKRLVRPLSIAVVFTNRCACNCIYCYAERKKIREAGLDLWISLFNEIAANEMVMVDIGGGDLFSRKDAFAILDEMISRDFIFFLSTKSYLSRYDADRLKDMGVGVRGVPEWRARVLQLSIDSADPGSAGALTHSPRFFERIDETVNNLVRAGIAPRVKAVLTSLNAGAMEGLVRHFHPRGVSEFRFAQYTRSLYRHDDRLFLNLDEKLRIRETAERLKREFAEADIKFQDDVSTGGGKNLSPEEWDNRRPCSGGRTTMHVKPDGDVTLCEQIPHRKEFVVGNVFEEGLAGVWNSDRLADFIYPQRKKFVGTVCFDCPEFNYCCEHKGQCFRNAYYAYGTIYEARPECPRQTRPCPRMI
jgi:MoaA/NifB/PqqE/SkfB family radical SAM enzyme